MPANRFRCVAACPHGQAPGVEHEIEALLSPQTGVVSRRQLSHAGAAPHDIKRMLRRRELAVMHPGVFVNHTGSPSSQQRAWAAVLSVAPAALCGTSAIRAAEGPGRRGVGAERTYPSTWASNELATSSGLVASSYTACRGSLIGCCGNVGPPRQRYDDAALDVAIGATTDMAALAVLAAACQQRRTTAQRLLDTMQDRPRLPRRTWLTGVLDDVAAGTCSVLEHGYLTRVERPHQLPRAERQQRATASSGVVYRDAEYP